MKMDDQVFDILGIFLIFLVIQILIFWFALLIPSKENYYKFQESASKVVTYKLPKQMSLVKGEYRERYYLKLLDQSSGKITVKIDCSPVTTDHLIAKFCNVFFNQTVRVISVDLYEKYDKSNKKIASKIRSIHYKDLDNKFHTMNLWVVPYNSGVDTYNAKKKFIFYTVLNFIVLLGYFVIVLRQKYSLDKFYKSRDLLYKQIFNVIKIIFIFIIVGQMLAVPYYLYRYI